MLNKKKRLEADSLDIIRDTEQPADNCSLSAILRQLGNGINETTVEMLMQEFEFNGHNKENLLEVLIARRAIESELAALAAQNTTAEELQLLNSVVDDQRQTLASGEMTARQDIDFHAIIARMARNQALGDAVGLIRQDTQLSPVLEYIRKHVQSKLYIDHDNIRQAILSRQPSLARQAMSAHINNLITDVERYWATAVTKTTNTTDIP